MATEGLSRQGSRDASISTSHRRRPSTSAGRDTVTGLEDTTFDPGNPRPWFKPVSTLSGKIWRQLLGLNPFKHSYISLFGALQTPTDRIIAVFAAIFALTAGVPLPIIGVIFGKIISSFPPSEEELRNRISQLLAVAVVYFIVTTIYTISFSRTGERIAIHVRKKLLRSLLYVDQAYLDTHDIDVNALLRDKIDTIQVGCSEKVGIFLQSMSYFVAAFTVGFILNAKLTGILFAAVIPTMAMIVTFGSAAISKLSKKIAVSTERANAILESALRFVKILQAYDMMGRICNKHHVELAETSRLGLRKAVASALELGGAYFTAYAANGLAFYVGSHMAAAGESGGDAGTIYAVVFLILDASFVVGQFAPFLEIFARAAAAFGTIQEILEACQNQGANKQLSAQRTPHDMRGAVVSFKEVSFAYPARPTVRVVNDLNLVLHPAAFNTIVGTSGGGKSTLVSLLLRIYDYSGKIFIGDRELRDLSPSQVRSQIAVLEQDSVLFPGTIFDNICHGLVHHNHPESQIASMCNQAAQDAGIDFLQDLPHGIHTRLDNTLQLSGGQRQRVCLARALIRNPAMLVLDEPTSALDARSEAKVMQAVKNAVENGITVLIIAHRLSTVLSSDKIAVVSDGKVVEEGTPSDLAKEGTIFQGLLDAQNTTLDGRPQSSDLNFDSSSSGEKSTDTDELASDARLSTDDDTNPKLRTVVSRFLKLTQPEHLIIAAGVFSSMISGGMIIGEAIVFGSLVQLLNSGLDNKDFQQEANFYCLMFFVLSCIALLAYVGSGTAFGIASSRLIARVQATLLSQILHLDIEWFSKSRRSASELASTIVKDSSDLSCLSGVALGTIFTVIVSVCGGIILAHIVAWKIAIVLLAAVPIMVAAGYIRLRLLAKSEKRHRTAYTEATDFASESCQYRRTVTILGLEEHNLERYDQALQKPYKEGLITAIFCNTFLALSFAITYFVYALAYWWGAKQVRDGYYDQKEFFIVLPALLFSAQSAGQLFSLSPEIARARTAAFSVFRLLSFEPRILGLSAKMNQQNLLLPRGLSSDRLSIEKAPKFEFKAVSFSYSAGASQMVLNNVNISVNEGETVALVGPSGAGKSSIVSLMERFFDPTAGEILFEGTNIQDLDVRGLRSRISLVPQQPELFPGSIEENIQLGIAEDSVTHASVETAAKQCGLHDFISSLPDGYNTDCGSIGNSQLSGGQRQRLSLARALIRDPQVLLLDEPTSALDANSERQVQDALQEAAKGRTIIVVAHRLASIQHVDKIVVLDGGKVLDQGTHSELMERGGLYASMAKAQALS